MAKAKKLSFRGIIQGKEMVDKTIDFAVAYQGKDGRKSVVTSEQETQLLIDYEETEKKFETVSLTVTAKPSYVLENNKFYRTIDVITTPDPSNQRTDVLEHIVYMVRDNGTPENIAQYSASGATSHTGIKILARNDVASEDITFFARIRYTDNSISDDYIAPRVTETIYAIYHDISMTLGAPELYEFSDATKVAKIRVPFSINKPGDLLTNGYKQFVLRYSTNDGGTYSSQVEFYSDVSNRVVGYLKFELEVEEKVGKTYHFQAYTLLKDGYKITAPETQEFELTQYGDQDFASVFGTATILRYDTDGTYNLTSIRIPVQANSNNTRTDIKAYRVDYKNSEQASYSTLTTFNVAEYATDANIDVNIRDDEGPDHSFKIYIEFFDGTSTEVAPVYTWTDPNYGKDDVMEIGTLVAGNHNNNMTPIVLTYGRSVKSEKGTPQSYKIIVDSGRTAQSLVRDEISVSDPGTYTYNAADRDGPIFNFRVLAVWSDSTISDISKTPAKEWVFTDYGTDDHVNMDPIAGTDTGNKNISLRIGFSLDSDNDKDQYITGYRLYKWQPIRRRYEQHTTISNKDARNFNVTHGISTDKVSSSYKISILWANDPDNVVESSLDDCDERTYIFDDYAKKDKVNITRVQETQSTGTIKKLTIDFEPDSNNDRSDYESFDLYYSTTNSGDASYSLVKTVNNPARVITYDVSDSYESHYFKIVPVWDVLANAPDKGELSVAPAYFWNNEGHGLNDKLEIIGIVEKTEVDDMGDGYPGVVYSVRVNIPASNDRSNNKKIEVYLLENGAVPHTNPIKAVQDPIDPNQSSYLIDITVPRNKGPNYEFGAKLFFDDGVSTPISNTQTHTVVFSRYGNQDRVVIYNVTPGARGDEGNGPYTELSISYEESIFNDRYGEAKRYILERDISGGSGASWQRVGVVASSSVTDYFEPFVYHALDSEAPNWWFRVRADYSGDGVDLNPAMFSNTYTYGDPDPSNDDTVIMLNPISTGRNVTNTGELITIPFQVPSSNRRTNIDHFVLWVKRESIDAAFVETDSIPADAEKSFQYIGYDADGPLWLFRVQIVFTDDARTDISKVNEIQFPIYDPKDESYIYITNINTLNIENKGNDRYDRLTIEFKTDGLLYPMSEVTDFLVMYSYTGTEEKDFQTLGLPGYVPGESQYFTKEMPRKSETIYFYIYANLKSGERTPFSETHVFTYLTPDFGDDDEILLTTPAVLSSNFDVIRPYNALQFGYTFSETNDRTESEVARYDLMLERNGTFESVAIATTSNKFSYDAIRREGPDFYFKGLIRYENGQEALSKSTIFYQIDDYGDFDHALIDRVYEDTSVYIDDSGEAYFLVSVHFSIPSSNDRFDNQKYLLYVSHNGEDGDYFRQTDLDKNSTDFSAFKYRAYAKDGADVWFKVRIMFANDVYSDLDQSSGFYWRNPNFGSRDSVVIEEVTTGPLIAQGETGFANEVTVHFEPSKYNTRFNDISGYELQVSNPLIDDGAWKNNGFSTAAGLLVFNAFVKYAPTWHLRVLIKYDDGTYSPSDVAEVYTFAQLDPSGDDHAVIKNINFKSRVLDSQVPANNGSNVTISFEADPSNNRDNIKHFDIYCDVLEDGDYSRHVTTKGKDEYLSDIFIKDSWGTYLYFKVKITFHDGSETLLANTPAYLYDNSDPDDDDHADFNVSYVGRKSIVTGEIGDELLVSFAEAPDNSRKNPIAFHLYVSKTGTEWSSRPEQTVYAGTSAFLYFARDIDGPVWFFKVIIEYAHESFTELDKTESIKYERQDPNDEDNLELFAPTTGALTTEGYQVQIAFRELPSNRRKNPTKFQLYMSTVPEGPYVKVTDQLLHEKIPFTFLARAHEGPYWFFKAQAFYADGTSTNVDKCLAVVYNYPSYGANDHAEILEIIDQAKQLSGGVEVIPLKIVFDYSQQNHRLDTTSFVLYAKTSSSSEFYQVPGQVKGGTLVAFDYQAIITEGPKWEFWVKVVYQDGTESTFQTDHVKSWENDSFDHAVIKSITLSRRDTKNGKTGSELFIFFEANEKNVRG